MKTKLKNIGNGVWTFLNSKIFVIIIIACIAFYGFTLYQKNQELQQQAINDQQNISALNDSITTIIDANGNVNATIDGYIASEKELKNLNKELYNEIQKQKGKVLTLTNTIIKIRQDSTELAKTVDKLNVIIGSFNQIGIDEYLTIWSIPHKFDDNNFFTVNGSTSVKVLKDPFKLIHDTTYLTNFVNQIHLKYGTKVENNKLRVYIESKYPGFTVESMAGVLIDPNDWPNIYKPEKRHWFTGFGVGPNISIDRNGGVMLGIGIHYNIYEW